MRRRTEDFCPIHRAKVCGGRILMEEKQVKSPRQYYVHAGWNPSEMSVACGANRVFNVQGHSAPKVLYKKKRCVYKLLAD